MKNRKMMKNIMKKGTALCMAGVMVFGMTACGENRNLVLPDRRQQRNPLSQQQTISQAVRQPAPPQVHQHRKVRQLARVKVQQVPVKAKVQQAPARARVRQVPARAKRAHPVRSLLREASIQVQHKIAQEMEANPAKKVIR